MENKRESASGIKIYDYRSAASHGFYISLFFRAGSMYEREEECGITHFFEHAAIRNVNCLMGGELYRTLDRCGIEFNASTYSEMVQFYITGARGSFRVAAEIIANLLSPIVLPIEDIATERDRIKAEIREGDERGSLANFTSAIVHKGTSLSRPITGTAGGISRISRARLEAYRRRITTRDNIFFYVTGNVTDEDLDYLASLVGSAELFDGEKHENIAPVCENFGKRSPAVNVKSADFTMVRFTFDIDMQKISVQASDLLYDLLLGGYNARLFIEMSENRGLCYDLSGAVERYKNIGSFTFTFEVKSGALYDAIELALSILKALGKENIPEDECMKAGYVGGSELLFDDIRELNFTLAYDNHIMDQGYKTLADRAAAYNSVTPDTLSRAARELFRLENLTLTMKGNKKKIDTDRIAALLEKFGK